MERGQRGRVRGVLPDVHAGRGHAQLGERVLHVGPAEHVHADPAEVLAQFPGRAEQRGVQRAAGQRHVRRRNAERAARRAYSYGTWLANRQASMPGPSRSTLSAASCSLRYAAATSLRAGAAEVPLPDAPAGPAAG